jgi:hypothetical protein
VRNIESRPKKQRPLSRREAFLERQRLVAERAEKKAEKATQAPSADAHTHVRRMWGEVIRIADAAFPQDFASAIAQAEQSGPRWNGSSRIRWQVIAVRPSPSSFAVGDRVSHARFGNGVITEVDGQKLTIEFDAVGQKRIIDSFVVRE